MRALFSMNSKSLHIIPTVSFCVCCLMSACKVVPHLSETSNSKTDALAPLRPSELAPVDTVGQPASSEAMSAHLDKTDPQFATKEIAAVAVGDDQASVIQILGKPDRSTQVATSNGERLAWEYFHSVAHTPAEGRQRLRCLIIFDQKTGRVKTIERYPQ